MSKILYRPKLVNITSINYGALYKWAVVTDIRNIAASGFEVPAYAKSEILSTYLGGNTISGGKLKETGIIYWIAPNSFSFNTVNFNARGGGFRSPIGTFSNLGQSCRIWNVNSYDTTYAYLINLVSADDNYNAGLLEKTYGFSIRLMKTTPSVEDLAKADGEACDPYVGNDGKYYRTVKIGTQVWVADNLFETKFRNGDYIHGYEAGVYTPISNANWATLTTEGMCIYDDDITNA